MQGVVERGVAERQIASERVSARRGAAETAKNEGKNCVSGARKAQQHLSLQSTSFSSGMARAQRPCIMFDVIHVLRREKRGRGWGRVRGFVVRKAEQKTGGVDSRRIR